MTETVRTWVIGLSSGVLAVLGFVLGFWFADTGLQCLHCQVRESLCSTIIVTQDKNCKNGVCTWKTWYECSNRK